MPRDSQGNTNPLPGTIVATGDTILPSQHNPMVNDVYAMMTQSLSRDGQGGMRAPLAMNGFPVRNMGPATQPNDAVPLSQFQSGTPVGSVVDFAGVTPPNTWMLCFGQTIEVNAYPEFVAACYVGNTLNATAGFGYRTTSQTDPSANRSTSGQFIVLPDLRGRVGVGKDNMGGTNANRVGLFSGFTPGTPLGESGGNEVHTLNISEIPSHNHTGNTDGAGAHTHDIYRGGGSGNSDGWLGSGFVDQTRQVVGVGNHTHSFTTNNNGGGQMHNNMQPSLIFNKIIKVSY